jgi:hypothetical protein
MKTLSIVVLSFILLTISSVSLAADLERFVSLPSLSYHFENFNDRKAFHPAIGYEYSPDHAVGWQAAFFQDSFGQDARYIGINYSSKGFALFGFRTRVMGVLNVMEKQYLKGKDLETRIIPMPILEVKASNKLSINVTGTPQLDYSDKHHTNGVILFQFKMAMN